MGNKHFLETTTVRILGWNVCGVGCIGDFLDFLDSDGVVWDVMLLQEFRFSDVFKEESWQGHAVFRFPNLDTGCRGLGIVVHSRNTIGIQNYFLMAVLLQLECLLVTKLCFWSLPTSRRR